MVMQENLSKAKERQPVTCACIPTPLHTQSNSPHSSVQTLAILSVLCVPSSAYTHFPLLPLILFTLSMVPFCSHSLNHPYPFLSLHMHTPLSLTYMHAYPYLNHPYSFQTYPYILSTIPSLIFIFTHVLPYPNSFLSTRTTPTYLSFSHSYSFLLCTLCMVPFPSQIAYTPYILSRIPSFIFPFTHTPPTS